MAAIKSLDVVLNEQTFYPEHIQSTIEPYSKIQSQFLITSPDTPGTYPVVITLRYLNDGQILSLRHMGLFNYKQSSLMSEACTAENATFGQEGDITIRSTDPGAWKIILPDEINIVSESLYPDHKVFHVRNTVHDFNNNYPYFAVAEKEANGLHSAALCRGTLRIVSIQRFGLPRGRIEQKYLLLAIGVTFLAFILTLRKRSAGRFIIAINKYSSRMLLIALTYLVLKKADVWIDYSRLYVHWNLYDTLAELFNDHLRGNNYQYFFSYFIDYYFAACLLLVLPYLYYFDKDSSIDDDKYSSFLKSALSLPRLFTREKIYWTTESKLGFLTFCVKFYFVPLFVSWAISNAIHLVNSTKSFQWELAIVNSFLIALFLYIDLIIFCFGYLFEFPFLKNTIKSVEPTVLGWLVCIMCYPPFNMFSFKMFDLQMVNIAYTYPPWVYAALNSLISILWGIFVWGSVALGTKASNLTNRGIVASGPYQYVRHPAYSSKLLIWCIQGIFFSQYFNGILLANVFIYFLKSLDRRKTSFKRSGLLAILSSC